MRGRAIPAGSDVRAEAVAVAPGLHEGRVPYEPSGVSKGRVPTFHKHPGATTRGRPKGESADTDSGCLNGLGRAIRTAPSPCADRNPVRPAFPRSSPCALSMSF